MFRFRKEAKNTLLRALAAAGLLVITHQALADSSSPRLAGYYDLFMAICGDTAYEWSNDGKVDAVAAGSAFTIALGNGALWKWLPGDSPEKVMACAA